MGPEPDHDHLWERVRERHDTAACRDHRYFAWRYGGCPGRRYRFVAVRRGRHLAAVAVFAPSYAGLDCAALLELVFDGEDREALAASVRRAESLALAASRRCLAALFPPDSAEAAGLAFLGYRPIPTGMPLVARSFDPSLPLAALADFHYSLGDFDLA
jgi:hypothetical protein